MTFRLLRRRRAAVGAAAAAALLVGASPSWAQSIPGPDGKFTACHDGLGFVWLLEAQYACPVWALNRIEWYRTPRQVGLQGERGLTGDKGPTGDPGPRDVHWARVRTDATTGGYIAASEQATQIYSGGVGRRWIAWPNVDLGKCAITVTPVNDDPSTPLVASHRVFLGMVVAQVDKRNPGGSTTPVTAEVNVTASCNQSQ